MNNSIAIAGAGIGGLAAALSCARAQQAVHVFERAAAFTEVGAGVQIGPNVTRILNQWGLTTALESVACFPEKLQVRQALTGQLTGQLLWGDQALKRYGAPYATIHRADLQHLLLNAVAQENLVSLQLNLEVTGFSEQPQGLQVHLQEGSHLSVQALIGADGIWSRVRAQLMGEQPARFCGDLAYRALIAQTDLPVALRSQDVTVWMGPHLHVVQYPVRRGELLNVVAIVRGSAPQDLTSWDHSANVSDLKRALGGVCPSLLDLIEVVPAWRLWPLCDRAPMQSALEHAQGRVGLLGDAAHPMRPYMAQGAGMAIEDADVLGRCLSEPGLGLTEQLALFATQRWQRNARVQKRAIRNGQIFHASGLVGWARDVATRLGGSRVLDVPWLYDGPQ